MGVGYDEIYTSPDAIAICIFDNGATDLDKLLADRLRARRKCRFHDNAEVLMRPKMGLKENNN